MADDDTDTASDLPAGDFATWLAEMRAALRGERTSTVPCDGCTACCTSSQFIHVGPEEADALAHIPRELLFAAPGLPTGNVLMGYDERGHCPMLIDNACSIYEHRPRACRTYDCRIFAATGVAPDESDKALVAARARRWRFAYASDGDRARHDAIRAAAVHIRAREGTSLDATRLAVRAVDCTEA